MNSKPNKNNDKKIIIADDDEFICNFIENILWQEGYENTKSYPSGEKLISALKQKIEVDLILLDVALPKMSGWKVVEKIRSSKRYIFVPTIMMTASDSLDIRKKVFSIGADDIINKPFPAEELIYRVEKAISQSGKIKRNVTGRFKKLKEKVIFSGEVCEISVASLLSFFESTEVSGTFKLKSKGQKYTFGFEQGRITNYTSTLEVESIEELLSFVLYIDKGEFQFLSATTEKNIDLSPTDLLLQAISKQ
ncbi:response regulator [Candidatus Uabimicrobium sp. HlEnr_7]|uniref:response regulator n=1 Tax=Candidatus Uabimicrobium helgolandensis TaxID=3095367 RepID=UPI0035562A22